MRRIRIRLFAEVINLLIASHVWERLSHKWHMRIWQRYTSIRGGSP
jgi:hypothetical protein